MDSVTVNGLQMAFEAAGTGPPLLLVAGTGYPGATWPPELLEPLRQHCTVIVFDHRGTGRTAGSEGAYSTRLFAADASGLLEALALGPAHVLGHSMGGRVAQWMALDAPERVRSLILAATGPGQYREDRPLQQGVPLVTARDMIELGYERYMREHIADTFFTDEFVERRPEVVAWLVDAFWQHRPSLDDYLQHIVARQQHQTAELLDRIAVPSLVLVGNHDTGVRGTGSHLEQSRYLADRLPNARLHVLEGAAHGYFWEVPDSAVALLVEWVASVESSQ